MKKYNKKTQTWKFSLNWTMSKIIEFVNRLLLKGYSFVEDYTSKNNRISFVMQKIN